MTAENSHTPRTSEGEKLLAEVQSKSTGDLLEWLAGRREGTLPLWIGRYELERRKQKWGEIRSWLTIGISVAALTVSIIALVIKKSG